VVSKKENDLRVNNATRGEKKSSADFEEPSEPMSTTSNGPHFASDNGEQRSEVVGE